MYNSFSSVDIIFLQLTIQYVYLLTMSHLYKIAATASFHQFTHLHCLNPKDNHIMKDGIL